MFINRLQKHNEPLLLGYLIQIYNQPNPNKKHRACCGYWYIEKELLNLNGSEKAKKMLSKKQHALYSKH